MQGGDACRVGAAHFRLSGAGPSFPDARGAVPWLASRYRGGGGDARHAIPADDGGEAIFAGHLQRTLQATTAISSTWRGGFSARPICGAAIQASASIAPASCSFRCACAGATCCAIPTCRRRRWAREFDPGAGLEALRRGDLVFWRGHVAIVEGDGHLLHASGSSMQVVSEPLMVAIARIASHYEAPDRLSPTLIPYRRRDRRGLSAASRRRNRPSGAPSAATSLAGSDVAAACGVMRHARMLPEPAVARQRFDLENIEAGGHQRAAIRARRGYRPRPATGRVRH